MKNNIIPVVLSAFSAILLVFSFAPFNLSFLAWFALIPLFSLLPARRIFFGGPACQILSAGEKLSSRKIFIFYYLAGLVFWACHIWWLVYVTFVGYCLLVIYLALFLGFFGLFLKLLREKTGYPLVFIAPPLWVIFELARTYLLISFPWSLLGYSQWQNIPLIQISSVTGVYGVSFLIVMINAAIADFIFLKKKKQAISLALSALIMVITTMFGYLAVSKENTDYSKQIKISVIQGNIPQDMKWDEEYAENIVNTYAELSIYASKEEGISLIVWPETSYPDYVDIDSPLFEKVKNLIRYTDTPLLMGAVNRQNNKDYNSALLIMPETEIKQTKNQNKLDSWQAYNKLHLVPFAEYIPLKKIFFFLSDAFPQIGDFSKGEDYTVFSIRNLESVIPNNFATLICFEDLFPDLARRFTQEGADFLVVITNDAHFHESPALWQHFTHSVFRAVENRRPLVRAANNGISGFIDVYGRPTKILNDNEKAIGARGYATNQISPSFTKTFYTRFGDLFAYLNMLYLAIVMMITFKKNAQK